MNTLTLAQQTVPITAAEVYKIARRMFPRMRDLRLYVNRNAAVTKGSPVIIYATGVNADDSVIHTSPQEAETLQTACSEYVASKYQCTIAPHDNVLAAVINQLYPDTQKNFLPETEDLVVFRFTVEPQRYEIKDIWATFNTGLGFIDKTFDTRRDADSSITAASRTIVMAGWQIIDTTTGRMAPGTRIYQTRWKAEQDLLELRNPDIYFYRPDVHTVGQLLCWHDTLKLGDRTPRYRTMKEFLVRLAMDHAWDSFKEFAREVHQAEVNDGYNIDCIVEEWIDVIADTPDELDVSDYEKILSRADRIAWLPVFLNTYPDGRFQLSTSSECDGEHVGYIWATRNRLQTLTSYTEEQLFGEEQRALAVFNREIRQYNEHLRQRFLNRDAN